MDAPGRTPRTQYLALLFTEIYLDRYFRDAPALLKSINAQIEAYNADKPEADQIAPLDESSDAWSQLNKLAFWMATGSGKTLVMHANILQYQHYLGKHGRRKELNRILLLTPNEGLSQQHLREFDAAGIDAELFSKEGRGLFTGQSVEILEVTRLRDEMGQKNDRHRRLRGKQSGLGRRRAPGRGGRRGGHLFLEPGVAGCDGADDGIVGPSPFGPIAGSRCLAASHPRSRAVDDSSVAFLIGNGRQVQFAGANYHILTQGDARRKLFHDAGHYEHFTRSLEDEVLRSGWIVRACCWMPNHIQALLQTP